MQGNDLASGAFLGRHCLGLCVLRPDPFREAYAFQVGSIEDNQLGGWYSYRMSKAALNMGIKTAAIEIARWRNSPVLIAVHPGTTHSGLSKPFVQRRKAPVQTADAAALRLLALEQSLRPEQHGSFVTLDAKSLPW